MIEKVAIVILANLTPGVEQIGGIPIALSLGFHPAIAFLFSLTINCLLFFPIFLALELFYWNFISKIRLARWHIENTRKRGAPYVNRYGVIGLTLFTFFPAPLTGTYTATILSWLLGLDWRKAFLAIFLGSFFGGIIILLASLGLIKLFFLL